MLEWADHRASKVIVAGGTASIPEATIEALSHEVLTERRGGATRLETSFHAGRARSSSDAISRVYVIDSNAVVDSLTTGITATVQNRTAYLSHGPTLGPGGNELAAACTAVEEVVLVGDLDSAIEGRCPPPCNARSQTGGRHRPDAAS